MTIPELLSPAGDLSIFKSVIENGADAVYFAGSLFGARAYAKNFTDDEVLEAIDFAHIYSKKAYLTVNTLLKNQEIEKYLYDYVKKFYEAGIDAVLVQDIGVYYFLKKNFKGLSLHVSTQASVSSHYGVLFFKELGADRVVLSRELSIAEIKRIKELTGMEIEVFVHGAMCVSYSGKCLMSSMIGGRSGNRGRCAQPCRQNYGTEIDGKAENNNKYYPLSMKDLCGIAHIPALIDAGVDSLKIEGRMKSKEYASGVTSVYRDFLNAYSSDKNIINDKKYMKEATDYLLALGNRGKFSSSYFYNRSSKEMISFDDSSLHTGSVNGTFHGRKSIKNKIDIVFKAGFSNGIFISMTLERNKNCTSEFTSDKVFSAEKRAVTEDEIKEKLSEISDTPFEIGTINIEIEDGIFIPMSEIKKLKRAAIDTLSDHILTEWEISLVGKLAKAQKDDAFDTDDSAVKKNFNGINSDNERKNFEKISDEIAKETLSDAGEQYYFSCLFDYQLKKLLEAEKVENIIIPASLFLKLEGKKNICSNENIFIDLPSVLRDEDRDNLERIMKEASGLDIKGFFASSYDSLYFLKDHGIAPEKTYLSPEIYSFSDYSAEALKILGYGNQSVPFELNENELRHRNLNGFMMTIYGKAPLMHLQDCIYRNTDGCHKNAFQKKDFNRRKAYYIDRLGKKFFDSEDCTFCQNTLYNTVPTELAHEMDKIRSLQIRDFRIDFTDEDEADVSKIISYIFSLSDEKGYNTKDTEILRNTTRGHFHRGVE